MYKAIVLILLFLICLSVSPLFNKPNNEALLLESQQRKSLLQHCDVKFQFEDEYYAICPYDKNIKVNYQEYVELNAVVDAVPEAFELAKLKSSESLTVGMIICGLLAACCAIFGRYFYDDDF